MLHHAVEKTFNRISIDGDTSTNDTVLLLASGASGVSIASTGDHSSNAGKEPAAAFLSALESICLSLAKQVVGDGEGIQHVVELNISGALSDADALRIARSIAHSPLVKTAWAGCDPNWGRILAAVGYSGVLVDPSRISIDLGDLELCKAGCVSPTPRQSRGTPIFETARSLDPCRSGLGRGSMPLLDYGSDGRIRGHQRRLLHVENFSSPPSIESSADRSKLHRSKLLRDCGPGNAQVFSHVCAKRCWPHGHTRLRRHSWLLARQRVNRGASAGKARAAEGKAL